MKIKTSATTKPAPEGAPTSPAPATPTPNGSNPGRRCRRPSMSTCDKVLFALLVVGAIAGIVTFATVKIVKHRGYHHGRHHGDSHESGSHESSSQEDSGEYESGQCKVREIKEQKDVCCPYKGATGCASGEQGGLYSKTWYKFKDEPDRSNMLEEDWEDVEENKRNDKFSCYQIVLDYEEAESDEESESSSEESDSHESGHRRGGHHHGGGHHRGRRDDHHYDKHGSHGKHGEHDGDYEHDMRESHEKHEEHDEKADGEDWPEEWEEMTEEDKRRWMEMKGGKEHHGKMEGWEDKDEAHSEEGIVVMNRTANGDMKWIFYESVHTQAHFVQCSYSACRCAQEKGATEIEEKMRKWRARMESQESFDCTLVDPNHESSEEDDEDDEDEEERHHLLLKVLPLAFGVVWVILLVSLMVRRCRAWKALNAATPTQVYAAPNPKEVEANLPPSAKEVEANMTQMSKEEEANLPPVYNQDEEMANAPPSAPAPAVVWTTHTPPTYESSTEQPPEYKSQASLRAMTPVV